MGIFHGILSSLFQFTSFTNQKEIFIFNYLIVSSSYSCSGNSLRLKGNSKSAIQSEKVPTKHKHQSKSKSSCTIETPSLKMEYVASKINNDSTDQSGSYHVVIYVLLC